AAPRRRRGGRVPHRPGGAHQRRAPRPGAHLPRPALARRGGVPGGPRRRRGAPGEPPPGGRAALDARARGRAGWHLPGGAGAAGRHPGARPAPPRPWRSPAGPRPGGGRGACRSEVRMDEAIRVLLADDHRFFRDGVRLVLDPAAGLAVAGEAATGAEAVALAEALQPDVILMDLNMPGLGRIEAMRLL